MNTVANIACIAMVIAPLVCGGREAWASGLRHSVGIREQEVMAVAVASDPQKILIATNKTFYVSSDSGRTFAAVFHFRREQAVYALRRFSQKPGEWYLATEAGLMRVGETGSATMLFSQTDDGSVACYDVAITDAGMYVATAQGIFYMPTTSSLWQKVAGVPDVAIRALVSVGQWVFASDGVHIYRIDTSAHRVTVVFGAGVGTSIDDETENADLIRVLQVSRTEPFSLFAAGSRGVLVSHDGGTTWNPAVTHIPPTRTVTSLTVAPYALNNTDSVQPSGMDPAGMLAGTADGIFVSSSNGWQRVFLSGNGGYCYGLAVDRNGRVYAATEDGLFSFSITEAIAAVPSGDMRPRRVDTEARVCLGGEPTVSEVQRWAIAYADVDPAKFDEWKKRLARKAVLPTFSVGVSSDKNKTIGDSVWGTYTSGGQEFIGSDDKTFYDNLGWDVSLSWDLSELVWDNDETSIDSRVKIMAELRDDIVERVTRLYFERKRLLLHCPAEDEDLFCIDHELRVEELTALIDALTGGMFVKGN